MDSFDTIMEHINIIKEAGDGCFMMWNDTQIFPEIKYIRPNIQRWFYRFTLKKISEDKMICLARDIRYYAKDTQYRKIMIKVLPQFASGLKSLEINHGEYSNSKQLFRHLLAAVNVVLRPSDR